MFSGLFGLSHSLTDEDATIEPFPPGHVEVYDLDHMGRAFLKSRTRFNSPGQTPLYKTMEVKMGKYTDPLLYKTLQVKVCKYTDPLGQDRGGKSVMAVRLAMTSEFSAGSIRIELSCRR